MSAKTTTLKVHDGNRERLNMSRKLVFMTQCTFVLRQRGEIGFNQRCYLTLHECRKIEPFNRIMLTWLI